MLHSMLRSSVLVVVHLFDFITTSCRNEVGNIGCMRNTVKLLDFCKII